MVDDFDDVGYEDDYEEGYDEECSDWYFDYHGDMVMGVDWEGDDYRDYQFEKALEEWWEEEDEWN